MMIDWRWARAAIAVCGLAAGLASCVSATRNTESLLTQAGFRQLPADSAPKMMHLKTLPERQLVGRTNQGQKYYVYADLGGCKCLYIGNAQQYQSYLTLAQQQQAFYTEGVEEAREWEIENSGL
jgi:hypothetical protein